MSHSAGALLVLVGYLCSCKRLLVLQVLLLQVLLLASLSCMLRNCYL